MDEKVRVLPVGDAALLIELGDQIDLQTNLRVRQLAEFLRNHPIDGCGEVVPAYASLLVHYDPLIIENGPVNRWIVDSLRNVGTGELQSSRQVEIPTIYGGEYGLDLAYVAQFHGLSVDEVIKFHSEATYTVYMMGFTPGFAYLGGLPPELETPRLESPRLLVKAGSIGIAGNQTGIYPIDSPGGWRIIGFTPLRLFDPLQDPPTTLQPGDQVRFVPAPTRKQSDGVAGH